MRYTPLTSLAQLDAIDITSRSGAVIIFKHSTRCMISRAAWSRLETKWTSADDGTRTVYHLDLLAHRDVSDAIEQRYGITHASPQLLVIRDGECVYDASHFSISYQDTIERTR